MNALHRNPRIHFSGRRGPIAVLALNGAGSGELRRALGWSRANGTRVLRVAVDGGLRTWRSIRQACDLFVGDADSAAPPHDVECVLFPEDKEFSDLSGALDEARSRRAGLVCVAGLIGGRFDHEWINLCELAAAAPSFRGLLAPTDRGWVLITARGVKIETRPGRPFSVLALGGRARVRLRGARWDLQDAWLAPGSRGLSNISGDELRVDVEHGVVCVMFPET